MRKSLPVASSAQVKVKEVPEYFDVDDDDQEEDEEGADDVQVGFYFLSRHIFQLYFHFPQVSEDPFASVEITELTSQCLSEQEQTNENLSSDFCPVCGEYLASHQVFCIFVFGCSKTEEQN